MDIEELKGWVGRSEARESPLTGWQADIMAASLDRDDPPYGDGDALPPAWHWLYFPEAVKMSEVGPDGHGRRGGFMPPVPLPRRMWASDRMTFHHPLRVGARARKVSTVTAIDAKEGAAGTLVFVTVRHEISGAGETGVATTEDMTVVYRDLGGGGSKARTAPQEAAWSHTLTPDPVLLFRFSALTMNSHRIHYDAPYVTGVEGYPGLLVHGPLTAMLLLDLFRRERPDATLQGCAVRAMAPIFAGAPLRLEGGPRDSGTAARVWAVNADGALAMSADLEL